MPKAMKKKREKAADFTKAKLKLGKGKKQASNATDTSFKARSIALPGQNPLARALANADEPVTNQGLTLDEVLLRFRHPNSGVRKEALGGVKDILQTAPERHVGKVLRALGGVVSDNDGTVRKALLGLLGWYLPVLDPSILVPHLPLFLLQTSSSLSHIFPEIRIDACKIVSLLLEHVPDQVVGGWPRSASSAASTSKNTLDGGNNILEGLRLAVGLGGEKGMNAQSGKLGASGRLTTLKTLLAFVNSALEDKNGSSDCFEGWVSEGRGGKGKGKGKIVAVPISDGFDEGWLVNDSSWAVGAEDGTGAWDITTLDQGSGGDEEGITGVLTQLYIQLAPLLQSTFLESAPTAFSPSASIPSSIEVPISLCLTTASLTLSLTRPILGAARDKEVSTWVSDFLRRMSPYFPFRAATGHSPTGLTPAMQLNLAYANIAVLLAPPVPTIQLPRSLRREGTWRERVKVIEAAWKSMREGGKRAGQGGTNVWALGEISEWIIETLAPNQDVLAPSLTPTTYASLLPILWSLLVLPPSKESADGDIPTSVGSAFLAHLARLSSASTTRALGDQFVMDLVRVHEQRHPLYPFFIPTQSPVRGAIKSWIENVPKVLWELGNKDEQTTNGLLRFLLEMGLRGSNAVEQPFSLLSGVSFPAVASKFCPFFHLTHPSRGPVQGPWTRLGVDSKRIGLDMARTWLEWDADGALARAVAAAVKEEEGLEGYWTRQGRA